MDRGRSALIVGTEGRPGAAFAEALAGAGFEVEMLLHGATVPPDVPSGVSITPTDLRDEERIAAAVRSAAERRGPIDVLITCPDYCFQAPLAATGEDQWEDSIALNLTSVFLACKHAAPFIEGSGKGCIVNVTSDAGRMGALNAAAYAAAKAAVNTFSKALARELAPGVRVNALSLGMIGENNLHFGAERGIGQTLLKRTGRWEEAAYAMLCLIGEGAGYLTGQTWHVNGGLYMP